MPTTVMDFVFAKTKKKKRGGGVKSHCVRYEDAPRSTSCQAIAIQPPEVNVHVHITFSKLILVKIRAKPRFKSGNERI